MTPNMEYTYQKERKKEKAKFASYVSIIFVIGRVKTVSMDMEVRCLFLSFFKG